MRICQQILWFMMLMQSIQKSENITYSLGTGGDTSFLSIDTVNGEIRLLSSADYETKPMYVFDVIISDGGFNSTETITLYVNDLNETVDNNVNQINTTKLLIPTLSIFL